MSHLTIIHTFCLHFVLYDDTNITHIIGFRLKCARVKENQTINLFSKYNIFTLYCDNLTMRRIMRYFDLAELSINNTFSDGEATAAKEDSDQILVCRFFR